MSDAGMRSLWEREIGKSKAASGSSSIILGEGVCGYVEPGHFSKEGIFGTIETVEIVEKFSPCEQGLCADNNCGNPNRKHEFETTDTIETVEIVETVLPCEWGLNSKSNGNSQSQISSELNPHADSFVPFSEDLNLSANSSFVSANVSLLDEMEDPFMALNDLKKRNADRPVIAHLNINSISSKF